MFPTNSNQGSPQHMFLPS